MHSLFTLFVWIAMGAITAYYARKRGQNPYLWFFTGLLLGILGLLFLFIWTSKSKLKRAAKEESDVSPHLPPPQPPVPQKYWYYLDDENHQHGPMSFSALENAWKNGHLTSMTYIWNEDLDNWKRFREVLPEYCYSSTPALSPEKN